MAFKFPLQKTEDWRFTDLTLLNSLEFKVAENIVVSVQNLDNIREHFISNTIRIVVINGFFLPDLSDLHLANNNLEVVDSSRSLNDKLSGDDKDKDCHPRVGEDPVASQLLNITVKTDLEIPIHFLNIAISDTQNLVANLHVNFRLHNNVSAKLIEEHISYGVMQSLYNSTTIINVNQSANLQHTFIQAMAKTSFNMSNTTANLARNSVYNINMIINGARLSRYDLNVNLDESNAEANIRGLCVINGRQIAGVKTMVRHNVSDSRSNHLHKSIVDGGAHSIFNGTICVALNASRTESHQQNRSLMLSKKSRVTTEPKLEINNDDVVCTHGATISQMDEDIVFFLKARGICEIDAKKLCIEAFANEIMNKIEHRDILKNICL